MCLDFFRKKKKPVPSTTAEIHEVIDYQEFWSRIVEERWDIDAQKVHFGSVTEYVVVTEKWFKEFTETAEMQKIRAKEWTKRWDCNDAEEAVRVLIRDKCPGCAFGVVWYIANPNHAIGIVALDTGVWLYEVKNNKLYQDLTNRTCYMLL